MPIEVKPGKYVKVICMSLISPLQDKVSDKRNAQFLLMFMEANNTNDSTNSVSA